MSCIFCSIIDGDIPSTKVFEDDKILAFKDINPMAPVHVVIIPKQHIESANMINEDNAQVVSYIFTQIPKIAKTLGIYESGYRVITNCGSDGCQSVKHLHFHLLGGKKLAEEMC